MQTTVNLNLKVYNTTTDGNMDFQTWSQDLAGEIDSNMTKIDNAVQAVANDLDVVESQIAGSGWITSAMLGAGSVLLNHLDASLKFQKIATWTANGSNAPSFTNIPQTFKHLLLVGDGHVNADTSGMGLVASSLRLRFNGDSTTIYRNRPLSHITTQFYTQLSSDKSYLEFGNFPYGTEGGTTSSGMGFGIIPNYTNNTFYKLCVSFGGMISQIGLFFSEYQSINPVTSISGYFPDGAGTTTIYAVAGTTLDLYGLN